MNPAFAAFAPTLLGREGNGTFTDRAADKGGPTRWGVDAATLGAWRRLGRPATSAEVQALGRDEALAILERIYFLTPGFDLVATVATRIAAELLDAAVNLGPSWPCGWLQRSLNLCNRRGADYADVPVSGGVGPLTMAALKALITRRGQAAAEDLLLKCLNGFQFSRYVAITEAGGPNGAQEENFVGWITQRIGFPA
jgi:lysozyme family protein